MYINKNYISEFPKVRAISKQFFGTLEHNGAEL